MSILGNRVLRTEDPTFLTAGATYLDDLDIPGAAHVTYVRSTVAHARLLRVDVEDARTAPGVIAVFVGADIDMAPLTPSGMFRSEMARPWLATDTVRFVGDPIAVIVTEERNQGEDAAELVQVDYDPRPMVADPEEAAAGTDVLLFPEAGTNLSADSSAAGADDLFDGCDVVVRQRLVNQRVAPCPLEVRATAARWEDDGRLTYWVTTQGVHGERDNVARRYGLEKEQVRAVTVDVGGGFGAKVGGYPDELLLPWIARRVGRPVRWIETRSESMLALGHGRGQVQHAEIGATRDGKVLAYRLSVLQDGGAYPEMGSMLPIMTRMMLTGVYDIPRAEFASRSVVTNTTPTVAYRGAGRPEAAAAIERSMDLLAAELGMDPVALRRRNYIGNDRFPFTTPMKTVYDSGDYERSLDLALETAGYEDLRKEQQRRRDAGERMQLGIGLSTYVEITNPGGSGEFGSVEVKPDGKVRVLTGTSPHGQGHQTAWAMLASEQLGVPIADIEVVYGDTDIVPSGGGTGGSRSLQAGGVAVHRAAIELVDKARSLAAELLEANPDDVVLDKIDRRFHVVGTPAAGKTWGELAVAAAGTGGLVGEVSTAVSSPTFPFGTHLSVVEVDTDTGKVTILRHIAVDDAGTVLNPLLADGQIHGGVAQGVAQALLEEVLFDPDGNPITSNFADYAIITAAELPSFETVRMETPTPINELGAKGIGESGSIGSTPAVQNAVVDALSHLGIRHLDMPATPEKVWRAINGGGEPPPPTTAGAAAGTGSAG